MDEVTLRQPEPGDTRAIGVGGWLSRRRSLVVLAAVCLGVLLARELWERGASVPSSLWFSLALGVLAPALLKHGRWCTGLLLLAAVLASGGWFAARVLERPPDDLARLVHDSSGTQRRDLLITVRGVVLDPVRPGEPRPGALARFSRWDEPGVRTRLRVDTVVTGSGDRPGSGVVVLSIAGVDGPVGFSAGDRVQVFGRFSPVGAPMNPGQYDQRLWGASDGRSGYLRVASAELIQRVDPRAGVRAFVDRTFLSLRAGLRERSRVALDTLAGDGESERALLRAILLGERTPALERAYGSYLRLGLAHFIAISGFHLALLAGVVVVAVRLTGDRGWVEPAVVGLVIVVYMLVLPVRAPIFRAGLMVLAVLCARGAGRRYDTLNVLGWVAVALIVLRPMDVFALGAQLSFGIVAVLVGCGSVVHRRLWGARLRGLLPTRRGVVGDGARWVVGFLQGVVTVSVLSWGVATPIAAYHTGLVSLAGPVATVLVLPSVTLVLVSGFVALVVSVIWPDGGAVLGGLVRVLTELNLGFVSLLDRVPGSSFHVPAFHWSVAVWASAVALGWLAVWSVRSRVAWVATGGLVLVVAGVSVWSAVFTSSTRLRIDALAIGDGTCFLLRAGDGPVGGAVLWDAGSLDLGAGRRRAPDALRALGAWRIGTAVVTHANIDHYSLLPDMAGRIGLERVLVTPQFVSLAERSPGSPHAAFLGMMRERGVEIGTLSAGDEIVVGAGDRAVRGRVLWPLPDVPVDPINDTSLVVLLLVPTESGERTVLLTGDIGPGAIEALSDEIDALIGGRVDVLEVPHHGSFNTGARDLLARLNPRVAIQSTGPSRLGDPRWATLRGSRSWFVTAGDGAVSVWIDRDGGVRAGSHRGR